MAAVTSHAIRVVVNEASWLPAAGEVIEITTDADGNPVNTLESVKPPVVSGVVQRIQFVTRAWSSAALAKDYCQYGALMVCGGGDMNYYGNEVYGFRFDTRRWMRVTNSQPIVSQSDPEYIAWAAGQTTPLQINFAKQAVPTSDWRYFNRIECEHGPSVDQAEGFGPLPPDVTPSIPQTFDALFWLPGSEIGNTRGGFCYSNRMVTFNTDQTGRSHYLDLDPDPNHPADQIYEKCKGWGRLSNNVAGPGVALSGMLPVSAYDVAQRKVYHVRGHLDLATKTNAPLYTWTGISYGVQAQFDPLRRLFITPHCLSTIVSPNSAIASAYRVAVSNGLAACKVDVNRTFTVLPLSPTSDTPWLNGEAYTGGFTYIPELDEYYFYTQGWNTTGIGFENTQNVWRIRPPSSNLDPFTNDWELSKLMMNGVTVQPDTASRSTYGHFGWNATLRCLYIYNGWTSPNVYLYRPEGI